MKKVFFNRFFIVGILVLITTISFAQDIVKLNHKFYTSYFSKSKHIPIAVKYYLGYNMVICESNAERYKYYMRDPYLPIETNVDQDYKGSGYSRGHNMSAADNGCNLDGMRECFYFSNMTPQLQRINNGIWKVLEIKERSEARVENLIITVGCYGQIKKIGCVVVPSFMFKVIYHTLYRRYDCYLFDMSNSYSLDLGNYLRNISLLEYNTGIHWSGGEPQVRIY